LLNPTNISPLVTIAYVYFPKQYKMNIDYIEKSYEKIETIEILMEKNNNNFKIIIK